MRFTTPWCGGFKAPMLSDRLTAWSIFSVGTVLVMLLKPPLDEAWAVRRGHG